MAEGNNDAHTYNAAGLNCLVHCVKTVLHVDADFLCFCCRLYAADAIMLSL